MDNTRGSRTMQVPDPIRRQGITTHTTPRHSIGPQVNDKRDAPTHRRGTPTFDGEASSTAALHSPCHPPSTTAPHHPRRGGEQTEDTPPHEQHRHAHPRHTAALGEEQCTTRTAVLTTYCSGMSRARAIPLQWARQQQHTPPPFHTPRRMDTIHSSTHLLSHCSCSHNR